MYEEPSQSSHEISSATSVGLPSLPIAICGNFDSPPAFFRCAIRGVSIGPLGNVISVSSLSLKAVKGNRKRRKAYGAIALTLTPLGPCSFAAVLVSPMIACLLATYAPIFACHSLSANTLFQIQFLEQYYPHYPGIASSIDNAPANFLPISFLHDRQFRTHTIQHSP